MNIELSYLSHLNHLVLKAEDGAWRQNRTGVETVSIFGHQMRHDLREGFPLLTTKKMFAKGIIHELLWFLKGDTNIQYLLDNGVHIWDEWADENGDLGPVYGRQWRNWEVIDEWGKFHIDQIERVIHTLQTDPDCRRMIVSAWNVSELDLMALAPCHCLFQFFTEPDEMGGRYLDCQLYQRSADWFLGVPFNIASYSLLTMMVAQVVGMTPRYFIHSFGDTHLYKNHYRQAVEQLKRMAFPSPDMQIKSRGQSIDGFAYEDFELVNYRSYEPIKAAVAV